jgi:tetratricopeptide (TPR) repeat protein
MTNSEIGPLKRNFLLFAAWCFDFCLVVLAYMTTINWAMMVLGPIVPYALPLVAVTLVVYWIIPSLLGITTATIFHTLLPNSPGRYLANASAISIDMTGKFKRLTSILAIPLILIFGLIGISLSSAILYEQEKLNSPEDDQISMVLISTGNELKPWLRITNPKTLETKNCVFRVKTSLQKRHKLLKTDLEENKELHLNSEHGFYSSETLVGRELAKNLEKYSFIDIKDVLITGQEYAQRQQDYLLLGRQKQRLKLLALDKQALTSTNIQKHSEILCDLENYKAASELLTTNSALIPNNLDLIREKYYVKKNTGNYKEAFNICKQLISMTPWLADWYVDAATILCSMNDYKESLVYLEKAQKTLPFFLGEAFGTTWPVHELKAKCLKQTGKLEGSIKEAELAEAIKKRNIIGSRCNPIVIPTAKNKARKLETIIAHFNPAQLKGQVIEPHVYAPEAKALVDYFENKKPSAKEIAEVLNRALNQQIDQLYQIKRKYDYSAAVAVKPLPPKKRELTKLAAELAKAW